VADHYHRGSIVNITNKSFEGWPEVLSGDELMINAHLDQLLHRSYVLNIEACPCRLREVGLSRV
jgi:hypothetical protein